MVIMVLLLPLPRDEKKDQGLQESTVEISCNMDNKFKPFPRPEGSYVMRVKSRS